MQSCLAKLKINSLRAQGMPLPVFLICSESGAVDRTTNRSSFFNVVEKVQITPLPQAANPQQAPVFIRALSLRITAVWMKEDADTPDQQYQAQTILHFPGQAELVIGEAQFAFTEAFQRISTEDMPFIPVPGPGILRVESRIRRAGEEAWLASQVFPIILEATERSS